MKLILVKKIITNIAAVKEINTFKIFSKALNNKELSMIILGK